MSSEPAQAATNRVPAGWIAYVLVALLAMCATAVALDWYYIHLLPYRWGPKANTSMRQLQGDDMLEAHKQLALTSRLAGARALGIIAGVLGLALALADACALRRPVSFLLVPVSAAIAAAAGAGGGYLALHLHQRFEQASLLAATMTEAIILQAAGWICAGLGVALGVWLTSLGRRPFVDTLLGGVLAGGLVGILYPPITAMFYPDENTDRLFPDNNYFQIFTGSTNTTAFVFWVAFTGTLFAAIFGAVGMRKRRVAATPPSAATRGIGP